MNPYTPAPNDLLDPKIDFVFKRIFGSQPHPKPLLDLLNAIFEAQNQPRISEITVINATIEPDWEKDKTSLLDIRAVTCQGDAINVEMQLLNQGDFIKRTLYYWSELYTDTLHAGDNYHQLRRTITINLLNFNLFPRERMVSLYELREQQDHQRLTPLMQLVFIELAKPGWRAQPAHLQQWLKFLIVNEPTELQTLSAQNPAIEEAFNMLNYLSQDQVERNRYFRRKVALMDLQSAIESAENKGKLEGKLEGNIEGKIEVAKNLLKKGLSVELVAEATGLSLEQISTMV